jgi:hypothetical protein
MWALGPCWLVGFFFRAGLVNSVFLVLLGSRGCILFFFFFCILLVVLCPFAYFLYAWGAYTFDKTSLILPIKKTKKEVLKPNFPSEIEEQTLDQLTK